MSDSQGYPINLYLINIEGKYAVQVYQTLAYPVYPVYETQNIILQCLVKYAVQGYQVLAYPVYPVYEPQNIILVFCPSVQNLACNEILLLFQLQKCLILSIFFHIVSEAQIHKSREHKCTVFNWKLHFLNGKVFKITFTVPLNSLEITFTDPLNLRDTFRHGTNWSFMLIDSISLF